MASVLLVTMRSGDGLPALSVLSHAVTTMSAQDSVLTASAEADVVVVDARHDLAAAKSVCQLFRSAGIGVPRLLVLAEGGFPVYSAEWGCDDFVSGDAAPSEYETRLRLLVAAPEAGSDLITIGGLTIDEGAYSVLLDGELLELTYTEFELLKYFALHPGRVFTRDHLLTEVWGYDYYGGTRTVDVHVRRLRAKLGPEHEALIGTVRNVGYRFTAKT